MSVLQNIPRGKHCCGFSFSFCFEVFNEYIFDLTPLCHHQVFITWASFMKTACWGLLWIRLLRDNCSLHVWGNNLTRWSWVRLTSAGRAYVVVCYSITFYFFQTLLLPSWGFLSLYQIAFLEFITINKIP